MADKISKEKRSENMSKIKSKDTSIEIMVRKWLFSRGFRYRKNDKRLPGKPDVVLPKYRTVVFVQGCFWHGHGICNYSHIPKSNVEFWEEKINRNKERDRKNYDMLKNLGWKVITVWECELKKSREERLEHLLMEIQIKKHL